MSSSASSTSSCGAAAAAGERRHDTNSARSAATARAAPAATPTGRPAASTATPPALNFAMTPPMAVPPQCAGPVMVWKMASFVSVAEASWWWQKPVYGSNVNTLQRLSFWQDCWHMPPDDTMVGTLMSMSKGT